MIDDFVKQIGGLNDELCQDFDQDFENLFGGAFKNENSLENQIQNQGLSRIACLELATRISKLLKLRKRKYIDQGGSRIATKNDLAKILLRGFNLSNGTMPKSITIEQPRINVKIIDFSTKNKYVFTSHKQFEFFDLLETKYKRQYSNVVSVNAMTRHLYLSMPSPLFWTLQHRLKPRDELLTIFQISVIRNPKSFDILNYGFENDL